jgi:H+/Cl- antiporter ClcA
MGLSLYFFQLFLSSVRTILFNSVFKGKMITSYTGTIFAYNPGTAWLIFWTFGLGYVMIGALLTTYLAPHTARSGTPQLMA